MTETITRAVSFKGTGQLLIPHAAIEQPVKDDTILVEFDGTPNDDVEVEFEFATNLICESGLIGNPTKTYNVVRTLEEAYRDVSAVIDYFDGAITANPNWIRI